MREVFAGYDVAITDSAPGARPGLGHPAAATLLAAVGGVPRAKLGWTDVARFAALGLPAVNYGPGDPELAHSPDEHVDVAADRGVRGQDGGLADRVSARGARGGTGTPLAHERVLLT